MEKIRGSLVFNILLTNREIENKFIRGNRERGNEGKKREGCEDRKMWLECVEIGA